MAIIKHPKIVVAGDVTVDSYFWTRPSVNSSKLETDSGELDEDVNWKFFDGINMCLQPGGSILISKILSQSSLKSTISIVDQYNETLDKMTDSNKILHTNIHLSRFPTYESNSKKVFRVKKFYGYTTPVADSQLPYPYPLPLKISNDDGDEDFCIIHDIGNGFRSHEDVWPKVLFNDKKKPHIIYYMNQPLFKGKLWKHVIEKHKDNLILILNSENLREMGINISSSLSWEKTSLELLRAFNTNEELISIKDLPNVIVRFNIEGAIHYYGQTGNIPSKLYFDPTSVEGGFWDIKRFGNMRGISLVFVSALAFKLISNYKNFNKKPVPDSIFEEGIKFGLLKTREFMKIGHGSGDKPVFYDQISKELFNSEINENKKVDDIKWDKNNSENYINKGDYIERAVLPFDSDQLDPKWSILKNQTSYMNRNLEKVAEDIVRFGSQAIKNFPTGYFGELVTVDRAEIESFRSIMNIMSEYINSEKTRRPLSIAVFGDPGSGKSFGITQVARCVDPENVYKVNLNISQFTTPADLNNAFHRIRDISLKGKIPLVFFDEFDCMYRDQPLGWLRYFLVPMQDGEFMDCGGMHPIGKSIFVFAGGIYNSFEQFSKNLVENQDKSNTPICGENVDKPISEKSLDFLSRLRGYVNILGPNKKDADDDAFIIRRAILLRSLIEQKVPNILEMENKNSNKNSDIKRNKIANINSGMLKVMLKVEKYKHGVRSMEAIIDMSNLRGQKVWQKAYLPPKEQLELHVDSDDFFIRLSEY